MEYDLHIQSQNLPQGLLLVISGQISLEACEPLQDSLRTLVPKAPKRVVLDLSQLTFVNSMGLGVLIEFNASLRQRGSTLVLAGIHDEIAELFHTTKLEKVFRIAPSVEAAFADE